MVDYTHSTPPDRAGATSNHRGKNPLTLERGRPLMAIDGPLMPWFSIGRLSLHIAQYAPFERLSRKPSMPRRSVIIVSSIVGPPHRLHSIAMSCLRLSFSPADINRMIEHIKNNKRWVQIISRDTEAAVRRDPRAARLAARRSTLTVRGIQAPSTRHSRRGARSGFLSPPPPSAGRRHWWAPSPIPGPPLA
jgi:hypothetical protein